MQEINELKNLVIQSLEANGVLGQIRAQIRSSVFKIIEMQETTAKKSAGFHWENPLAQTIYEHKEGAVALELIHDFLEFFKMDYTLSVFNHESNLKDPAKKEELAKKLGVTKLDASKPIIFSIINSVLNGEQISPGNKENSRSFQPATQPNSGSNLLNKKEEQTKPAIQEKSSMFGSSTASTSNNSSKTAQIITNLVEKDFDKKDNDSHSLSKNKGGFSLPEKEDNKGVSDLSKKSKLPSLGAIGGSGSDSSLGSKSKNDDSVNDDKEKKKLAEAQEKMKQMEQNIKSNTLGELKINKDNSRDKKQDSDEYEDEQFENVEEELFEGEDIDEDLFYKQDKKDQRLLTSSEDIIAASQSQGFDISVDSLALEEYDYYEDADRHK